MSKLLKFIVNLFLIAAILIAVAILVPPLAGVTTTIVDTSSMNTNLPLGSVTYSTDIDVFDIKEGDEILKENDSSTYAYVIRQTDAANGKFVGVSATDENGAEEDIVLRNTVSKVAVVVPFIGYVLIAMHSIEGIIIVVLIVVLMIILFILSELWKARPEEEETEEEQPEEEEPRVTAREETGIDTDAIRAAVEENHSALTEDAAIVSQAAKDAEETLAAGRAEDAEEAPFPVSEEAEDLEIEKALADLTGDAGKEEREITVKDEDSGSEVDTLEKRAARIDSAVSQAVRAGRAGRTAGEAALPGKDVLPEIADAEELPAEDGGSLAQLAEEMEERAKAQGTDGGYSFREAEEEEIPADSGTPAEPAEAETSAEETAEAEGSAERFVPVARPALDEILAEAKDAGKDPYIKKDDRSGISLVDVSELL